MKSYLTVLAVIAAVVCAPCAPMALAQGNSNQAAYQQDRPIKKIIGKAIRHMLAFKDATPLTSEQREGIRKVLENHGQEIRQQVAAATAAHKAVRDAIANPQLNQGEVNAAAQRVSQVARDGVLLRVKVARDIRPLLTPEQQQRIDSMFAEIEATIINHFG